MLTVFPGWLAALVRALKNTPAVGNDTFVPWVNVRAPVVLANVAPLFSVMGPAGVSAPVARPSRFKVPPLFTVMALMGPNALVTVLSVPP